MNKSITYVNKMFSEYAEANPEIQEYKASSNTEVKSDNLLYPLMWVSYDNNLQFKQGEVIVPVTVIILDRMKEDKTDEIEVQSNVALMAYDFYTKFNENEHKYKFTIDVDADATLIDAIFDDRAIGYSMIVDVKVRGFRNELEIPE